MRNKLVAVAIATVLGTLSISAHADDADINTFSDLFKQGHVDGELRLYQFNRSYDYDVAAKPSARAFGGSLLLNAQTASLDGFSAGASLVSANALGSLADNPKRVDTTLMGASDSLTALSQAYLQYKNDWVLAKAGYQYLNTPWMGNSDGRLIPSSYEAISAVFTPVKGWNIIGIRELSYRSRTSDDYFNDNNYYASAYQGDTLYGGNQGLPLTAKQTSGTWALGSTYVNGGLKAQGWYYDFLDFARMGYADGSYVFDTGTGFNPVIGFQGLTESGGGSDNVLVANKLKIAGVAGTNVKSRVWGADFGVDVQQGRAGKRFGHRRRRHHFAVHRQLRHRSAVHHLDDSRSGRSRSGSCHESQVRVRPVRQARAAGRSLCQVHHRLERQLPRHVLRRHLQLRRLHEGLPDSRPLGKILRRYQQSEPGQQAVYV
jgi:hypothetical protein